MLFSVTLGPGVAPSHQSLDAIEATAGLARSSGRVVHVVIPRERGVVAHARTVADELGLTIAVDLMASTVRVRFSPVG